MILSIVIPSFQMGHEMAGALESIRRQNFHDYEIIIMDGGSNDTTDSVVKDAADLPITFIQESDSGVYDAMNKAVRLAKAKWVYFMGADDRLFEGILLSLVGVFAKNDLDVFYGNVTLTSNGALYDGPFDLHKLLCHGNICHQAIFYRKNVFDTIGNYNLKYKIWADWDFNIRCFKHMPFRIDYVDKVIAYYNNQYGVSSTYDTVFCQELPAFYLDKIAILEKEKKNLLDSKSFKIGNKIVNLFRKVRPN